MHLSILLQPFTKQQISPFFIVFSKDLYCRHIKARACFGKGLMMKFDLTFTGHSCCRKREKMLLTSYYGILMGPPKTSHVETCDNLSFSHFLACHLSYIHTRFNNPREITGATFYVLNSRLCFLKSCIVN